MMDEYQHHDSNQRQMDEVEALAAIYGDDWCCVNEASRVYCIGLDERSVGDHRQTAQWPVSLQMLLPAQYPEQCPPIYQLNAPWLRCDERNRLAGMLEEVYSQNVGESVIYLWVEKIRDFLQNKSTHVEAVSSWTRQSEECVKDDLDSDFDFDFDYGPPEQYASVPAKACPTEDESGSCPEIHHGDPLTDRRSTFQAHLASITRPSQVQSVLDRLYQNKKIANATHNMYAYRILVPEPTPHHVTGCDDDGETQAGSRMMHLLKITGVENVLVVVSRWYGGIMLGADRFKIINNCTRNILVQHGFIEVNKEKPRSKHKTKS